MSITDFEKISDMLAPFLPADLGRVTDVAISGDRIRVLIDVNPDAGTQLEQVRQKIQTVLETLPQIKTAQVLMTAEKQTPPALQNKAERGFSHKISNRPVAPKVRHMIAVASGKGGVGKSTIAAHLARSFMALGQKTGLLDADIYGASQPLMMGVTAKPEARDDGMITPLAKDGLKVMSMGFFVDAEAPVIWRGPMVHSAIQQLLRDVDWGDLDVLVIDLPPGTGDAQLSLAQYVPLAGAVIVSTPQQAALTQAKKGLKMFEKTKVPVLGIIENMQGHTCSNCGHHEDTFGTGVVRETALKLNVDYLGALPLLPSLARHADAGTQDPAVMDLFSGLAAKILLKLQARPRSAQA